MTKAAPPPGQKDASKDARMRAALRANLARRKAQARARAGDEQTEAPQGSKDKDADGQHHR